jgi:hypothetical protein
MDGVGIRSLRKIVPAFMSAVVIPWWLSGGILPADCLLAYAAKGAADYAGSKVNLHNPGTYDAVDGAAFPTWNVLTGWLFVKASAQYLNIPGLIPSKPITLIARILKPNAAADDGIITPTGVTTGFDVRASGGGAIYHLELLNAFAVFIAASTSNIAIGADVTVGVSYSGVGAWAFYLNGAPDGSGVNNQVLGANATAVGGIERADGYYKFMALYSAVLTAAQIGAVQTAMAAL